MLRGIVAQRRREGQLFGPKMEEITFDSYASEVSTSDAWWSEVTLDGWESSEVFPSDSWWSGVKSEEVAIEGWQHWKT